MRNKLKRNTRIKLISLFTAIVLWMYVMAIVDPEDTKLLEDIPVTITNEDELQENDLVVYPTSDLVADIYITGKLSDLQKVKEDDIHIYGSINNPIEGQNYLYLKVNTNKQLSYEFKSDFIVVKLEKLIYEEKDITLDIVGEFKDDVDTVTLEQSSVNVSGPRVLMDEVDHVKAIVEVNNKTNNKLNQRVKLIPVDSKGNKVSGVSLDVKNINAEIIFLTEKEVPINIQLKDDTENTKAYEINPKVVTVKGKKEALDKVQYINTEQIDSATIGDSKKIDLVIPNNVTASETNVVIEPKDNESLVQRLIYNRDEIELVNNSDEVTLEKLNIPDNINVEIQMDDSKTQVAKSDISLYIDLQDSYDETKEYNISYKSNLKFKNIKIIPSVVNK